MVFHSPWYRVLSVVLHLKEHPSGSLLFFMAWQRTVEQPTHKTTVYAWLKMVVIV